MLIYYSALVSLVIQFLSGTFDAWGLSLSLPDKHLIFRDILGVELTVQIVEFIFYIWLVAKIKSLSGNVTIYRYFDWLITTPVMLITLMAYLNHNKDVANLSNGKSFRLIDFLKANKNDVLGIVFLNMVMLLVGLVGEFGIIPMSAAAIIGFIPFYLYFKQIYDKYVNGQPGAHLGHYKIIFWYFVLFWSLYGIAAFLPHTPKNVMYNILDIFAKNMLGVILVYIIWKYHKGDWK